MEGVIFDIKRFAIHDGPGLRTTIFLKGCPLACWWCHNPEGISPELNSFLANEPVDGKPMQVKRPMGRKIDTVEIFDILKREKPFMDQGSGGVTLSGGEPLMQPQFAKAILEFGKNNGIHTAVDTCGAVSEQSIKGVLPFTDLFLYDIKFMQSELHKQYTGAKNDIILTNFIQIVKMAKKAIVRIPLIPGLNTTKTEQKLLLEFLKPLQNNTFNEIHFLPYHRMAESKYRRFGYEYKLHHISRLKKDEVENFAVPFNEAGFTTTIHNNNLN